MNVLVKIFLKIFCLHHFWRTISGSSGARKNSRSMDGMCVWTWATTSAKVPPVIRSTTKVMKKAVRVVRIFSSFSKIENQVSNTHKYPHRLLRLGRVPTYEPNSKTKRLAPVLSSKSNGKCVKSMILCLHRRFFELWRTITHEPQIVNGGTWYLGIDHTHTQLSFIHLIQRTRIPRERGLVPWLRRISR